MSTSVEPTETWHVYLLQCADQSLYTGIAKNLKARVEQHERGLAAKYTRSRRPVRLVYCEPAEDRSTAQRREMEIKRMSAAAKRRLVANQVEA